MRRLGLLVLGLALGGCKVLGDAFSAHPTAAARAAGQTLSVDRLAEVAAQVKGMPLQPTNLSRLAGAYVDFMLFAVALAQGENLDDTSVVAHAMWPAVTQLKLEHFLERLNTSQAPSDREIDSIYGAGELRAFAHILVAVAPSAAPPAVQQKQAQANGLWRTLATSGGAAFAAAARRASEDPGSKVSGGYLDVSWRGRFVPQFEDAAWQLAPGAMSGVVRSNFGFHIIRRPALAEIRDTFAASVRRIIVARNDSTYLADLTNRRQVRVSKRVGEAIRGAMQDLGTAGNSNQRLASYAGGEFQMKDFVRWVYAVDPRIAQALPSANDSMIGSLVQQMAERTVAIREADSAHVQLADSEWAMIRFEYDSTLTLLRAMLQLDAAMARDSATTPEGRARFAMARVNAYFDRVVGGGAQFFPIPPLLAQVLRQRSEWSIDAAAVRRAAERATALRAASDSLRPPGGEAPPGAGMRPAPGPAPVPPVPDSLLQRPPSRRIVQ
ncbi:MAG TPA: peptidylprolyl isomerase [Gemmatimonadales bacterium]